MYAPQRSYLKSIVICVGIRRFNVAGRAKQIHIYTFVRFTRVNADSAGLMWKAVVSYEGFHDVRY